MKQGCFLIAGLLIAIGVSVGQQANDDSFGQSLRIDMYKDCATALMLCSKDSLSVEFSPGGGEFPDEADNTCLDAGGPLAPPSEANSVWLKWTCWETGTLIFDMEGENPLDDLDFALYELSDATDPCGNKQLIRCNASSCAGPTGLNFTSTDTLLDANCSPGEIPFLRYVDMTEGTDYALLINNFSSEEGGFTIRFGGTGTFLPEIRTDLYEASCNPEDTGVAVLNLTAASGCDSVVTIYTDLLPSDSLYIGETTCDPDFVGIFVFADTTQFGCDSIVYIVSTLLPSDAVTVNWTTCDSGEAGTMVTYYTNQYGCDSIVTEEVIFEECTCPPVFHSVYYQGCSGDAYSIMVNGTVYDQSNPDGTETFIGGSSDGCDSVVTVDLNFEPVYETYIESYSCFSGDTGVSVQQLFSVSGCDSIVTEYTALLPVDSVHILMGSCNPADTGTVIHLFLNQYGCDSVVTIETPLLPIYDILIEETTCDPADTGTVVVHLLSVDICDSIVTTVTTLDASAFGALSGYVYFDGSPIDTGQVRLIRKDGNSPQTMMDVDIVQVGSDGSFAFGSIAEGAYLLKALGDTSAYEHVATYADSTNHWQKARNFELTTCDTLITDANIYLIDFPATIGFGKIDGTVAQGSGGGRFTSSGQVAGEPLAGVPIALERISDGAVRGSSVSNGVGVFTFRDIETGEYTLWADIPGYIVDTTLVLDFEAEGNSSYYIEICVDTLRDSIEFCAVSVISSVTENGLDRIGLFPNPASDQIILRSSEGFSFDLALTDLNGILFSEHRQLTSDARIDVSHLPSGVYLVRLSSGDRIAYRKLIIQR